ncbi:glycosyltransferase family 4 protein [Salinarimonas soli]|uniref:Glycosyltransferase family 4 protein n=1 Tax=Salinarimonas soli TaxID=1638099 RepID=A0A5B2VVP8_9HYPH|nr:glycosyltransferase family 4 protein [Salinarimonas soli]KAA2242357.1 glycosyltransferase family 4 protein [Salinarimonas soli]
MAEVAFAIPGDLASPTGGYVYDREVLARLPDLGVRAHHLPLPDSFPEPSEADLAETARRLAEAPAGAVLLVDGLAFGALPPALVAGLERPIVALVHHPLGLEPGLAPGRAAALLASERAALVHAPRVVVTSRATARILVEDFGLPMARVTIAEPGTEPAPRAHGTGSPVGLLAVGAVSPRKGFRVLVEALSGVRDLDWRLTIAGALDRAPDEAAALRAAIRAAGLGERVTLAGNIERADLDALYAAADVMVSPSLFEGYGMALAEALARGLPLVASTGGAAGDTVPDEAALKVPPGDAGALAEALRLMIEDEALRRARADAAWAAGQALPRWSDTARLIANVIREVAP